jgi:phage tail-like protein
VSIDTSTTVLEHCYRVYLGPGDTFLGTFLEVTGLAVEYESHEYAEGGNNGFVRRLRGRLKQSNLTLKSGVTDQTVLLQWVLGTGAMVGSQNLTIQFVSAAGELLRTFGFANAMPIRWTGPDASIGQNRVATESLVIAHQGLTTI